MKNSKFYRLAGLSLVLLALSGCGAVQTHTVTPKVVAPSLPSSSDTNTNGVAVANSGVIAFDSHKLIVTQRVVDRYNAFIVKYGNNWHPPLKSNDGIIAFGEYRDEAGNLWTNTSVMSKPAAENMDWMVTYDRQPKPADN